MDWLGCQSLLLFSVTFDILKYDFEPDKLPGRSRNGSQESLFPCLRET